jgi:hypothetical protein
MRDELSALHWRWRLQFPLKSFLKTRFGEFANANIG